MKLYKNYNHESPARLIKSSSKLFCLLIALIASSCDHNFLDERPSKSLVVPSTLEDYQALLDNRTVMNTSSPIFGEFSSDDFIQTESSFNGLSEVFRDAYVWDKDLTFITPTMDWNRPYLQVYYSNVVLNGMVNGDTTDRQNERDNLRGSALFYRANAFFNLTQIFAAGFEEQNASESLGIVLKINSDIKEKYQRATIQETYNRIIGDLTEASELLTTTPLYKTRPSKQAAYGLLARVMLTMGRFEESLANAEESLNIYDRLIDYNSLNTTVRFPFKSMHEEVIFEHSMTLAFGLPPFGDLVDTILYESYDDNDLRKVLYFNATGNKAKFKGMYTGGSNGFSGIATDELYLICAECKARLGDINGAMAYLNDLMLTRWGNDVAFPPFEAENQKEALDIIIRERRKELLYRGLRWSDLKRLNTDPEFRKTLVRSLGNATHTLLPDDPRYALPIPMEEVLNSGIKQNPR